MKDVPHFRGVFMRDELPKSPRSVESGVVNLDTAYGPGSHWVAYFKNHNVTEYFDSFGNLKPPKEILRYLGNNIQYNHNSFQKYNQINCGHLALKFLINKMLKQKNYKKNKFY